MSRETGAPFDSAVPDKHAAARTASNFADLPQASKARAYATNGAWMSSLALSSGSAGSVARPPDE